MDVKKEFDSVQCTVEKCFFYLILEHNGDLLAPENYVLPSPLKKTAIARHILKVSSYLSLFLFVIFFCWKVSSIVQLPYQNIYEVTITATHVAAFVWLDAHDIDGKFSENGFMMVEPEKTVYFYPEEKYTLTQLQNMIEVTHSHNAQH